MSPLWLGSRNGKSSAVGADLARGSVDCGPDAQLLL